jgi:hypothetical protein
MSCPDYGAEITNGDDFCNSCGTHIKYAENSEQEKKYVLIVEWSLASVIFSVVIVGQD